MTHKLGEHIGDWIAFPTPGRVEVRTGKVEIGQGVREALTRIAAEELDIDPAQIDLISGDTARTPDEGYTAGSMSISGGGVAVRQATSAARALFEAAGRGEGRPDYWALSDSMDLDRPVADFARPKSPAAYVLTGTGGGGRALNAQVKGAAFIHDLEMPGLLHARMVRPPWLGAEVKRMGEASAGARVIRDGSFIGVVCEREADAVAAGERLALTTLWSKAPGAGDPLDIIDRSNEPAPLDDAPISVTASRGFIAHASIAPSCAVAMWDQGRLTVWTHTQGVFPLARSLAAMLSLDADAVRVIHAPGAGCYGHNGADDAAADAAMLAMATPGRPVRVQWTRAQELTSSPMGAAMRTTVSASLGADGRIATMHTGVVSFTHVRRPGVGGVNLLAGWLRAGGAVDPVITGPMPAASGGDAERNATPGYDIAETSIWRTIVQHPLARTSALRSLGAHVNVTALEGAMDASAALTGEDPVVYRLRHLSDPRARAVIERVAAMAGGCAPGSGRGIGYARYKNVAAYCAVIVETELAETLRVTRAWAVVDAGCAVDPDGVENQIEGGIIQALSWTLKEAVNFADGAPSGAGWSDYPILRLDETPQIVVEILQHLDQPPLGVGEAACGPTAAAVCNALAALTGVRTADLPLTRERLARALG